MLSEVDVMKSLEPHPHVVRLIGCRIERGTGLLMNACCFIFTANTLETFVFVVNCLSKWRVLLRLENYCLNYFLPKDEYVVLEGS